MTIYTSSRMRKGKNEIKKIGKAVRESGARAD